MKKPSPLSVLGLVTLASTGADQGQTPQVGVSQALERANEEAPDTGLDARKSSKVP